MDLKKGIKAIRRFLRGAPESKGVIEMIKAQFGFLEDEFNYQLAISSESDEDEITFWFIGYTNLQAGRQAEFVVKHFSGAVNWYIKRLIDGLPPDYKDNANCYQFDEIDQLLGREECLDAWIDSAAYLEAVMATVKEIDPVLMGKDWFDRNALDEIRRVRNEPPSGWHENEDILLLREHFSFLVAERGFEIVFDDNQQRPFTQWQAESLVFQNSEINLGYHFFLAMVDRVFSVYEYQPSRCDCQNLGKMKTLYEGELCEENIVAFKEDFMASSVSREKLTP